MSVTGFNLRSFSASRSGGFMPRLQNPAALFHQTLGAGMCIPGDALPPGARRRRRRRAGGRPGLFPREAQLDPSQLLAQQSRPQTELPESRRRRRFETRMDIPRGSAGAGSHPGGMHAPPCAARPPQILWTLHPWTPACPCHCGKHS